MLRRGYGTTIPVKMPVAVENFGGRESGIFGSAESSTTKAIEVNLFLESHSVNGSRAVAAIERASVFLR